MMKLLIDQGLPCGMVGLLREAGVDAVHTSDIGAGTATDADILQIARREARVVVTRDADFHALLALSGATLPSVIRMRYEGLRAVPLTMILLEVLTTTGKELEKGALVTVHGGRIRRRDLPIVR